MGSSKKGSHANATNKRLLSDFIETLEIAPGIRFPFKRLLTESGRQEAELLRREWLRNNHDPKQYIEPGKLKVGQPASSKVYFELDTQIFISGVAAQIARMTAYRLGHGEHPDAPRVVVARIREILHTTIESELRAFIFGLMEDTFFETLLSLEGELRYSVNRIEVRKEWGKRVSKRADKKRRKILAREGLFPTSYLLREALSEAVEAILKEKADKKITQSEIVKYFSGSDKYAKCSDESTLRLWLRKHHVKNWKALVKELLHEHEIRSRLGV